MKNLFDFLTPRNLKSINLHCALFSEDENEAPFSLSQNVGGAATF
jgi:hypothetical protein